MGISAEHANSTFQKTRRTLVRLAEDRIDSDVLHNFRTTTRRLETLLTHILPDDNRNEKKLLKMLDRIRRRAGKVRDLDLELAALRNLKISQEPRRKTQLIQQLIELRLKYETKLRKLLKHSDISDIDRRLKKATKRIDLGRARDPLGVAKEILESVKHPAAEASDEVLHRYRTAVKSARYAAEFASKSAESVRLVSKLQHLQDALGNWHDWQMVTQAAEENLGEAAHSSLLAALRNLTRGKYRQALATVSKQDNVWAAPAESTSPRKMRTSAVPRQNQIAA